MENLNKYISIYKKQLERGEIQVAYKELVNFMMKLRRTLINNLSEEYSFAGILNGYMDYTYVYYSNDFLRSNKLKFAVVLNHLNMRFELWLLGNTSTIQYKYWALLKNSKWNIDRTLMPRYSVLELVLIEEPDFNDLNKLTLLLETKLKKHSEEILEHLNTLKNKR